MCVREVGGGERYQHHNETYPLIHCYRDTYLEMHCYRDTYLEMHCYRDTYLEMHCYRDTYLEISRYTYEILVYPFSWLLLESCRKEIEVMCVCVVCVQAKKEDNDNME